MSGGPPPYKTPEPDSQAPGAHIFDLARRMDETRRRLEDEPILAQALERAKREAVGSRGVQVTEEIFDLSTSGARQVSRVGYGLIYRRTGSTPAGRVTVRTTNGTFYNLAPGEALPGMLDGFTIERGDESVSTGTARIVVALSPEAWLRQAEGELAERVVTTSYSAAYNVTTNTPSAATDGISLEGVRGLRAQVVSAVGSTIAAGSGRWWLYSPTSGLWSLFVDTAVNTNTLATGVRSTHSPDLLTTVGYGRAFYEVLSATNSAGSGAFTVYLEAIKK